jgi:hypothetical protein
MHMIVSRFLRVFLLTGLAAVSFGSAITALATEERLLALQYGVIVKFCVWPVRRQSCLTDRSRVRRP